jgi:hypothetical protein
MMYCFNTRTGQVCIDHQKCEDCDTLICIEACRRYGAGILSLHNGQAMLNVSAEEAKRLDTECLACEIECFLHGQQAITISLPIAGLQEFRKRHGHTAG